MAVKYSYTKFANLSVLTDEIEADGGITTALDHLDAVDDALDIWFDSAISGAEETALDAVVSAHTNPATIDASYERDDQEVGDAATVSTTSNAYVDMAGMTITTNHHDSGNFN